MKLQSKAEREARQRIARTHPFESCEDCKSGWVLRVDPDGAFAYAERCRCWWAHQAKIAALLAQHARGGTPERQSA